MQRTTIVSTETLAALIEAHASMAAWYYELWRVLREGGVATTPDEAVRKRFVARLAEDFPDLAPVASSIAAPRLYVPPPPAVPPPAFVVAVPPPPEGPPPDGAASR